MRAPRVGCLALALILPACAIDAEDLRTWRNVKGGDGRLAGFLADPEREDSLRILAASVLLDMQALGHIMGVLRETTVDDRRRLLPGLAARVVLLLGDPKLEPADQGPAVDLGYHLLRYAGDLDPRRADELANALAEWALAHFDDEQPVTTRGLDEVLLAAAATRPEAVLPSLFNHMKTAAEVDTVVGLAEVARRLRSAEAWRQAAAVLLEHARKRYPDVPRALAAALIQNGNETLLRFLVEAARDPRVPTAVRVMGLDEASEALGEKAVPGLLRLIAVDDPAHGNDARWHALDRIWELAGVERLRDALRALPPDGTWPTAGEDFKAEVDLFCDTRVSRQRVAALPVLTDLLDDNNWVARIFAVECIIRLYPDDAPRLLAGLADDQTPLPGWSADGRPTTVGEVVRRLGAP